MLKTFRGLVLVVAVLVGSACVTPTHASSASIVISQIRANGFSGALEEQVVLFNNSNEPVNVTNWCLRNSSGRSFACFLPYVENQNIYIPPLSHAVVVSQLRSDFMVLEQYSLIYTVTNANSGSIVASGDTVELIDSVGNLVSYHTWDQTLVAPLYWQRVVKGLDENGVPLGYHNSNTGEWYLSAPSSSVLDSPESHLIRVIELPENDDDDGSGIDDGSGSGEDGNSNSGESNAGNEDDNSDNNDNDANNSESGDSGEDDENVSGGSGSPEPSTEAGPISITELLPDPVGADKLNEYIEIYNSGSATLLLDEYSIVITWPSGDSSKKKVIKLSSLEISPKSYLVISNADVSYSLVNSTASVRLLHESRVIDETTYENPKEGFSWAKFPEGWFYTNSLTPGYENVLKVEELKADKQVASKKESQPKPCLTTQYRNPETGRCKNISSSSSSQPKPCSEDQERNPETGRCRNVKKVTQLDYGVLGVESKSDDNSSYWLWVLAAISIGVASYAIWEWRHEILKLFRKIKPK